MMRRVPPPVRKQHQQRITRRAGKAKGRELQKWVCQQIGELTGYDWGSAGSDSPIESRGMGQCGCDVRLESCVRRKFPFSVECKRQESWSVPAWIRQAKENQVPGTDWLLVMRSSREEPMVVMDALAFFKLLRQLQEMKEAISD